MPAEDERQRAAAVVPRVEEEEHLLERLAAVGAAVHQVCLVDDEDHCAALDLGDCRELVVEFMLGIVDVEARRKAKLPERRVAQAPQDQVGLAHAYEAEPRGRQRLAQGV